MPENTEKTPGPWELMRAIEGATKAIEGVRDSMLTKDRFDEYQRGTDRRFDTQEQRQATWEAKSERAHGELEGQIKAVEKAAGEKIEAVEKAAASREEKERESRGRVWLAIGVVVLGVLAPRIWGVLQASGTTP